MNFSSRLQVYRVVIAFAVLSGLLLVVGLVPLLGKRVSLSHEIARMQASLLPEHQKPEETLEADLKKEQVRIRQLAEGWKKIDARVESFRKTHQEIASDPRRVDYKVERDRIITNLLDRARVAGAQWPKSDQLGIPTDISSGEDPARRMIQLKSAGAVLRAVLDAGMTRLESVRLLDPIERSVPNQKEVFAIEFPIEVVAVGDIQALARWILGASAAKTVSGDREYFFIVRNMKAEKASPAETNAVRATMIFNALLLFKIPQLVEPSPTPSVAPPTES